MPAIWSPTTPIGVWQGLIPADRARLVRGLAGEYAVRVQSGIFYRAPLSYWYLPTFYIVRTLGPFDALESASAVVLSAGELGSRWAAFASAVGPGGDPDTFDPGPPPTRPAELQQALYGFDPLPFRWLYRTYPAPLDYYVDTDGIARDVFSKFAVSRAGLIARYGLALAAAPPPVEETTGPAPTTPGPSPTSPTSPTSPAPGPVEASLGGVSTGALLRAGALALALLFAGKRR